MTILRVCSEANGFELVRSVSARWVLTPVGMKWSIPPGIKGMAARLFRCLEVVQLRQIGEISRLFHKEGIPEHLVIPAPDRIFLYNG